MAIISERKPSHLVHNTDESATGSILCRSFKEQNAASVCRAEEVAEERSRVMPSSLVSGGVNDRASESPTEHQRTPR